MSDALQIHDKARGLFRAARILEWVAIIGGVLGVIAGLAVAGTSEKATDGTTTSTPYGGLGFSIVLAAVLNAALFWAIARALVLFAMDVNSRHSKVPLDTSLSLGSSTRPSVWPPADQGASASASQSPGTGSTGSEPAPGSTRVWSRGAPKPPPPTEQ
jgi:hypothetical protein